ncbi:hypothetical protein Tco_1118090 [Tanacetum coccineum]
MLNPLKELCHRTVPECGDGGCKTVKLHGVPVTTFSEDGLSAIATKLGTSIMLDSYTADMCLQSWGRSSYARVMIELRADVELKDTIVVAMPKINKEGFYTCNNPGLGAGAGEIKKKKFSQAPKGVSHTANSSGNKKKGVDFTNMVSDSNPFEVLNSVDNDVEMGTNGGRQIWIRTGLIQVEPHSGMSRLVVLIEYLSDHDSEDEVASVDNDMARSLALERTRSGTQSLLEQWMDSHGDDD